MKLREKNGAQGVRKIRIKGVKEALRMTSAGKKGLGGERKKEKGKSSLDDFREKA